MPSRFSSGKHAIAECDRCGFRYKLSELKNLVIKTKNVSIKVCQTCWEPDQPQLQLGLYPVNDPQAVREPRPDVSYYTAGPLIGGDGGSRIIQWGWNPVGNSNPLQLPDITNDLSAASSINSVNASAIYVTPPSNFLFGVNTGSADNPIINSYNVYMGNPSIGFSLSTDPTVEYYVLIIDGVPFTLHPVGTVGSQVPVTYFFTNVNNQLGVAQLITGFVPGMVFQPYGYSYDTINLVAYTADGAPSITLTLSGSYAKVPGYYNYYNIPTSPTSVWYSTGTPYVVNSVTLVDVLVGWDPPSDSGNGPIASYTVSTSTSSATVPGTQTILTGIPFTGSTLNVYITSVDQIGANGVPYTLPLDVGVYYFSVEAGVWLLSPVSRCSAPQAGWYVASAPYTPPGYIGQKIDITYNWSAPTHTPTSIVNYDWTDNLFNQGQTYGNTTITVTYDYVPSQQYLFQVVGRCATPSIQHLFTDSLLIVVQIP